MDYVESTEIKEEDDSQATAIVRFTEKMEVLSSAPLNGGHMLTDTVFFMQVPHMYQSSDYLADIEARRERCSLPEDSVGFMTSAEIKYVFSTAETEVDGERVFVAATAGATNAVCAGELLTDWDAKAVRSGEIYRRLVGGTINIIAVVPRPMTDSAKINAMIPLVEGKTAGMQDMGYRETGTTSDAMAVISPAGGDRIEFAGTGTPIGISLAKGVRQALCECLHKRGESPYALNGVELLTARGADLGMLWECARALGLEEPQRKGFESVLRDMAEDQDVCAVVEGILDAGYMADRNCIRGMCNGECPPVLSDGTWACFLAGNISEDRGRDQTVDLLGTRPLRDRKLKGYIETTVYGIVGGVVGYLTGYSDE